MTVLDHATIARFNLPGISHQTIAGHDQGLKSMEVWLQTVSPGAASPVHRHDCEEVIVVLRGSGRLIVEGESRDFGPDTTLVVPPDAVHQVINSGDEDMQLVAALGAAPVRVRTVDGAPLPVPWEAPLTAG